MFLLNPSLFPGNHLHPNITSSILMALVLAILDRQAVVESAGMKLVTLWLLFLCS
ncbi:hypothetical protein REPUB_Repub01dG0139700 [Reevesia pubescens]